jgi:steroid delta-isomerase-like uncharacterized protein
MATHEGNAREHKAVARQFAEHVSNRSVKEAAQLLSEDFRYQAPGFPEVRGPDEWAKLMDSFYANSPKLNMNFDSQIAEGNSVVTKYTWTTVHENEFMGMPPTGKELVVSSLSMHTVEKGKIVHQFVLDDYLSLFHQLGAVPLGLLQGRMTIPGVGDTRDVLVPSLA